jgi:hypothetical protein
MSEIRHLVDQKFGGLERLGEEFVVDLIFQISAYQSWRGSALSAEVDENFISCVLLYNVT